MRRRGARSPRSGWWVVAGGSLLLTLQNGLIISAFGAYLVVITADTGWAPGVIAFGYAIVQLGNGFLSPLTGWCCDRLGVRSVARVGTAVTAAGFALAAAAADAAHLVAGIVVIALGCSAAGITPLTVAVVQTMTARRTLALGLLPTGIAVGGLVVPLVAWALAATGWRATFAGVAVVILVVGQLACASLPSGRGPRAAPVREASTPSGRETDPGDHDLRSALRTSAFWLLVVGHGTALVAVSAVSLHLVPLMTHQHGVPLALAGLTVAMMSIAQLAGQVVTGLVGDRIDQRVLAAVCMVAHTVALVALALVPGTAVAMTAAVVHGLAWGLRGPVMTALRSEYFGTSAFGAIMGWSMGLVSIGLVVGPLLVTALVERSEGPAGYPVAFLVLAAVTAAGAVAFTVLRRPRPPVSARVAEGDRDLLVPE